MLNEEMWLGLEPHEVYVGGLLHDVWKLKLAHLLKQPSLKVMDQQGTFITDPETEFMYWNPHPESGVPMLYEGVFFTDEQREEMHIHPVAGGAIVATLGYPQTVIDGSAQHHEYFTFQGEPYPAIPMREECCRNDV
jgi:HD-GYP domain-containing protein (c-di-GMP phosphodiesterase class II)